VTALLEQVDVCFISGNAGCFLNVVFHTQNEEIVCKYRSSDISFSSYVPLKKRSTERSVVVVLVLQGYLCKTL
jgi:hypothetical protein